MENVLTPHRIAEHVRLTWIAHGAHRTDMNHRQCKHTKMHNLNYRNQWIISLLGKQIVHNPENNRVVVPLLGAGCSGFSISMAIDAAAKGSTLWLSQTKEEKPKENRVVAFGLLETSGEEELASKIEKLL